jgi:hypothetical protein
MLAVHGRAHYGKTSTHRASRRVQFAPMTEQHQRTAIFWLMSVAVAFVAGAATEYLAPSPRSQVNPVNPPAAEAVVTDEMVCTRNGDGDYVMKVYRAR